MAFRGRTRRVSQWDGRHGEVHAFAWAVVRDLFESGNCGGAAEANPQIAGTSAHIVDITDTTQAGSTRRNSYRIDFSKPAAVAYIRSQVAEYERWGVDFIKFDFVGPGGGNVPADDREELRQWHAALAHVKRPIWLELSNYLSFDQAELWRGTANGWRIENDIECYGACDNSPDPALHGNLTTWSKVVARFADVVRWIPYAGPDTPAGGGWNDLDTLELGNGERDGITPAERQTMFTLWAIECAPLYLGSDLTKMDAGGPGADQQSGFDRGRPGGGAGAAAGYSASAEQAATGVADDLSGWVGGAGCVQPGKRRGGGEAHWREVDALRDTRFAEGKAPVLHDLVSGTDVVSAADGLTLTLEGHASRVFRMKARR